MPRTDVKKNGLLLRNGAICFRFRDMDRHQGHAPHFSCAAVVTGFTGASDVRTDTSPLTPTGNHRRPRRQETEPKGIGLENDGR